MKKTPVVGFLFAVLAAVVYFASKAGYAFPGQSAHLQAVWRGLDPSSSSAFPLMGAFAKMVGGGNVIAPVCGVFAVLMVYFLVAGFIRRRAQGESTASRAGQLSMIAGGTAAFVFMFTPAVREAASHIEPRLFDAAWAMLIFHLLLVSADAGKGGRSLVALAAGLMTAFGLCDSAIFAVVIPLVLLTFIFTEIKGGRNPFLVITLYVFSLLIGLMLAVRMFDLTMVDVLQDVTKGFKDYYTPKGWIFVAIFSTVPFFTSVFSSQKAFTEKPDLFQWLFHVAMTIVTILAVATPLSPSSLMEQYGTMPVMTSAYAAITAGYLASYWWLHRRQVIGIVSGVVIAFVLVFSSLWNLFTFEVDRGAFADEIARKVIGDLGERHWLVTDGVLDDHLLIVAAEKGVELNLISLNRDLDEKYISALSATVEAKKVGGSKNEDLLLSLSLGVLPFVQDWFSSDPTVGKEVAIWGAPDIWYSAGHKPIPELLFFGADDKKTPDWSEWKALDALLDAEKGWGSYRKFSEMDPVTRLKMSLRRHIGLVANNRGVYLQDQGKKDEAFSMYDLVLTEIDTDNVCALFNEVQMAGQKHPKALARKRDLERQLKTIIEDKTRRYILWRLASYYGYIRNPETFVRLGFAWARSGRPGDALAQIRRAIDFVPADKQSAFLNMMAALYASENEQQKSRKIYESVLAKNAGDHDALIGLMRLELIEGNSAKALEYLERAVAAAPEKSGAVRMELAMVAMMKNDYKGAKELLRKAVQEDDKNLRAWSMLASVSIQQYDGEKDEKVRAALLKEVSDDILPKMEQYASSSHDYYVQLTKAFVLMRSGEEKRKDARQAFEMAAKARPDSSAAKDLVLGLDISLDDRVSAERHAREVLRQNRKAPLANYVMGSQAIRRGEFREAEAFLRKAVNVARPTVLALNDLAEVLRRNDKLEEAERYARKTIERAPEFYIAHETLGVILLDAKHDLDEAESSIRKAIQLSKKQNKKGEDVRLYTSLAKVQVQRKDMKGARNSLRKVQAKLSELTDYEKREFEEVSQSVH